MANNIWQLTATWKNTTNGTFAQNVLYFKDGPGTMTAAQVAAKFDDDWWGSNTIAGFMRNFTSANVRLEGMSLRIVSPLVGAGSEPVTGQLRTGTVGNTQFHVCLGLVFTLKDGGAGRSHRGRFYHYGVPDGMVTKSGITTANLTGTIQTWINNIIVKFGPEPTSGLRLMLRHKTGPLAGTFTEVTEIRCAPNFGVQRRRNFAIGL